MGRTGNSPADLDAAMADARLLATKITDGMNAYFAGKEAETAELVRQFDACAQ